MAVLKGGAGLKCRSARHPGRTMTPLPWSDSKRIAPQACARGDGGACAPAPHICMPAHPLSHHPTPRPPSSGPARAPPRRSARGRAAPPGSLPMRAPAAGPCVAPFRSLAAVALVVPHPRNARAAEIDGPPWSPYTASPNRLHPCRTPRHPRPAPTTHSRGSSSPISRPPCRLCQSDPCLALLAARFTPRQPPGRPRCMSSSGSVGPSVRARAERLACRLGSRFGREEGVGTAAHARERLLALVPIDERFRRRGSRARGPEGP
jgi:hypothetical protein